jgi:hypothetical protein
MLEGKCSKCGYHRIGWALRFPQHQSCPTCSVGLEIYDGSRRIHTGYSPFSAEGYYIDPPNIVPPSPDKEKDSHQNSR